MINVSHEFYYDDNSDYSNDIAEKLFWNPK